MEPMVRMQQMRNMKHKVEGMIGRAQIKEEETEKPINNAFILILAAFSARIAWFYKNSFLKKLKPNIERC